MKQLFDDAMLRLEEDRSSFVDLACADDPEVRRELERMLLKASDRSSLSEVEGALDEALETLGVRPAAGLDLPSTIGPYTILGVLGKGGMGTVYEGEQITPIRRRVAVKVIRAGLDTGEVLDRFESERQALALMEHPNIARVLEAGVTDDGRPYFAMEHISGVDISTYCDRERLSLRRRIELVVPVCAAIQHAHQKGVLHRDVKPSNVLVAVVDGKPVPKLIDFGIAKATSPELRTSAHHTSLGRPIGTLEYMSPEQAGLLSLDVDTRADVYSLGALLHELLVGCPPVDLSGVTDLAALQRTMLEAPRPRPSTRVRTLEPNRGLQEAAGRRLDPRTHAARLEGDLDWIVMKALDTDRERRYPSAAELAADLQRHLSDEPVLARPPSRRDRLGKFARRHRLGVTAGALGLAAVVLTAVVAVVAAVRIKAAERHAQEEAQTAQRVARFLGDLFQEASPGRTRGQELTAREMLDRGVAKLRQDLDTEPRIQAPLFATVGEVYHTLGAYDVAERMLLQSLELQSKATSSDDAVRARILLQLAWVHNSQGKPDQAEKEARQALDVFERDSSADQADLVWALTLVGVSLRNRGDLDEAETQLDRALRIAETRRNDPAALANALYHLAWLHHQHSEYEIARDELERALPLYEAMKGQDAALAWCLNDLGVVEASLGHYDRSLDLHRRALEIRQRILGESHPDVAATWNNLANLHLRLGELDEAQHAYEEALDIRRRALGPSHLLVGRVLYNLGFLAVRLGDEDRAIDAFSQALAILEANEGEFSPALLTTLGQLAVRLAHRGELAQAEELAERIYTILDSGASPPPADLGTAYQALASVERARGDRVRALENQHRAVEEFERAFGPDDISSVTARQQEEEMRGDA